MKSQKQKRRESFPRRKATAVGKIGREKLFESDGTYFLKLVVFVLLGTFWIKFGQPMAWMGLPINAIPVGILIGLLLVRQFEKQQSDRKIWYAILLVVGIVSYLGPAGIVV